MSRGDIGAIGSAGAYRCSCGGTHSAVTDSRVGEVFAEQGVLGSGKPLVVRRRRKCLACGSRITTWEIETRDFTGLVDKEWRKRLGSLMELLPDSPTKTLLAAIVGDGT